MRGGGVWVELTLRSTLCHPNWVMSLVEQLMTAVVSRRVARLLLAGRRGRGAALLPAPFK